MSEHPIQGLMKTSMEQIKTMIDANVVVGDAVETAEGIIMPISKVCFGFAAGGSEYRTRAKEQAERPLAEPPFGGGSGGGVSITPIAFLFVSNQGVKVLPLDNRTHLIDRVIDTASTAASQIQSMFQANGKQADESSNSPVGGGLN